METGQTPQPGREATLRLEIAEGWHILSNAPGPSYAPPMTVTGDRLRSADFPPSRPLRIAGVEHAINVFDGVADIQLSFADGAEPAVEVMLQACSDKVCLPPQVLSLKP